MPPRAAPPPVCESHHLPDPCEYCVRESNWDRAFLMAMVALVALSGAVALAVAVVHELNR